MSAADFSSESHARLPSRLGPPSGGWADRLLPTTASPATLRAGASMLLHVRGLAGMQVDPADWTPPGAISVEPAYCGFFRLRSHLTRDLAITITKHWRQRGNRR